MTSKKAIFRQTLILLPVYVNVVLMGATVGWIANALYLLKQPSAIGKAITFTQGSWIAASTQVGKLVFAIPAGILTDKIGRKKICTGVAVTNVVCWLTLSISQSIGMIFFIRFMQGVTIALLHSVALMLIGEIASPRLRGTYVGMYQVCSYTGTLFESIVAVIFPSYRILAYATTALGLIYFALFWWLEESPSYLLSTGKDSLGFQVLRHIRPDSTESELNEEFDSMKRSINAEKERKNTSNFMQFLFSPVNRNCLLLMITMHFFACFTGSAPLSSYVTLILPKNNYVEKKFYPLISVSLKISSAMGVSFILDKLPRKVLYVSVTILVFVVQMANGFLSLFRTLFGSNWDIAYIIGNYVFLLIWASFLEPINDLVRSEILPQNIKGFGSSLCVMSMAASKALSYTLFETISINMGMSWNYWIFAINSLITAFVVYFALPESRGKSLADIQHKMSNDVNS
ncbi:facilitated trehalose transporter Tret1-2 homolog [Planococcus citri]|uniref:facilitated trehalose transporter Tret1-2 homolog n=1 Tax=Planococcus citri TaxID=170843 RepID=UPI0031F7288C